MVEVIQDEAHRLLERRSLPYRRAVSLIQLLVDQGIESISLKELELYIKGHIGNSHKTVCSYLELMRQFELIEPERSKFNVYRVSPEKCFFPPQSAKQRKTTEEVQNKLPSERKFTTSAATGGADSDESYKLHYSKTFVHLEERGAKHTCSFKGYEGSWKRFRERCKSFGLDICYVMDAFINAFLITTDEGKELVSTPINLGLSMLFVNLILPYVVQKPRRRRKRVSCEEEEF